MAAMGIWLVVNGKLQNILRVLYSFQESKLSYSKVIMCSLIILTIRAIMCATTVATQHPSHTSRKLEGKMQDVTCNIGLNRCHTFHLKCKC
jgi:hypothetical protein